MATTISRLGRTPAVATEAEKRSRCPSKRRGRRPSLRASADPEFDATPKNLMSSVDDEGQSDEDEALLFNKDRSSNSRSSNGKDRRAIKHTKSASGRETISKVQSADALSQSPRVTSSSKLRGSGTRRSLSTDELQSLKPRGQHSPKQDGIRSPKARAPRSTSPATGASRRGMRTGHSGSMEAKGRASPGHGPSRRGVRRNRSGKAPSEKLKPVTKLDDSDSEDDGMPLSYLGGVHSQQGHAHPPLDDDIGFASDYSSATEDETSARGEDDATRRERRTRSSSRRQHRRSSHSAGMRQSSIRKMLPADDSEFDTEHGEEEEDEKRERRKKTHSSSKHTAGHKHSSGQRTKHHRGDRSQPDALQFSPSNRRASYTGNLISTDDTETEVDETETAADDEQSILAATRRQRTRLSMDVLRADFLHTEKSVSEGKKQSEHDKRIEADMAHAMQRLEAHDAEASKKKKKGFGQLLGMFKKSDTSESGYESNASTSRDPSRGVARNRSRLVKNVLPHTLLDDSDSEHQEVDLYLAAK